MQLCKEAEDCKSDLSFIELIFLPYSGLFLFFLFFHLEKAGFSFNEATMNSSIYKHLAQAQKWRLLIGEQFEEGPSRHSPGAQVERIWERCFLLAGSCTSWRAVSGERLSKQFLDLGWLRDACSPEKLENNMLLNRNATKVMNICWDVRSGRDSMVYWI